MYHKVALSTEKGNGHAGWNSECVKDEPTRSILYTVKEVWLDLTEGGCSLHSHAFSSSFLDLSSEIVAARWGYGSMNWKCSYMSSENGVNPPAPNPSHNSSFSLLSVLGRERLTGPNYMDWIRNLRFTLRYENKEYVLDEQIPTINDNSTQEEIEAHQKHYDDANKVRSKQRERLDVVKSLMACKLKPEASICAFVLEMKGYFDRLESLNMVFDVELSINIILSGLPADYNQFVLSYQMNGKETSIMELHSLLQTVEQVIKKNDVPLFHSATPVLTVGHNAKKRKTSHSNWKGKAAKGKSDRGSKRKFESEIAPTGDPKEAVCFYCNTKGHWKRSCPKYLKDLKDGKVKKGGQLTSPCNGIYETVECIDNGNVILNVGSSNELDKSKLWHSRLGHINKKRIAQLQKDGVLESFDFKSDDVCESCLLGKITKSPFTGTCKRGEGLLDLVHTDVCGPFQSATKDGKRYYVTFTDDFSRYGYVYLIKHKSDTFEVFKRYQNEVENQLGRKIKNTHQLNGVAERRNRTLLDMVRSMMCRVTLQISFWGYALEIAAHILNIVPTKKVSKTPFEMWKRKRPSLGHIKIWGCEVFVRREAQDKLEAKSEKCLFIGYPKESLGYLFYKPKDNVMFVARRGVFLEREMISKKDSVVTPVEPNDVSLPIHRTSRVSKPPQNPQFYYGFHIEEDKISDSTLSELDEPANYKEAMASPKAAEEQEL
ncbi:retrotransposon protein, putative, ty1-copia subclass [Tanacetum coccineum]